MNENHSRTLRHVRAAIYGEPWAITWNGLEIICGVVETHVAGNPVAFEPKQKQWLFGKPGFIKRGIKQLDVAGSYSDKTGTYAASNDGAEPEYEPYSVIDGVALLPLQGPLFPKANLLTMFSGATSYQEFGQWLQDCLERTDVNAICIVSDSPGGSVRGLAELCDMIFAARDQKPIVASCSDACSAALAVVSQCENVYVTASARMGSVGVISRYENSDRADRNAGIDPVTISTSELKSGEIPETVSQYSNLVANVMTYFDQFKEILQRGRSNLDLSKVDKAQIFVGKQAVQAGLADGIRSLDAIIAEYRVA